VGSVLFALFPLLEKGEAVLKTRKPRIQDEYCSYKSLVLVLGAHRVEHRFLNEAVASE
jgi:hypothetical protein